MHLHSAGCVFCGDPEADHKGSEPGSEGRTFCGEACEGKYLDAVGHEGKSFGPAYFKAARGPGWRAGSGLVRVTVMSPCDPEPDADGMTAILDVATAEAVLPAADATRWLVERGCMRHEAARMVGQVGETLFATSTGAVPTTGEWVMDSPVERES